jgi:erythromycin esterase
MKRPTMWRSCAIVVTAAAVAAAFAAHPAGAQRRPVIPMDPALSRWLAAAARPLPSMDAPYSDSAYAWIGGIVGDARVLALGENIHGGHEPLAFRNHAIRYAVRRLGFTAVAIESGFTEGAAVDRFIQGDGDVASIDSVLDAGISYGFSRLPENRELVLWLREHNRTATSKVRFYGVDQSGVGEADMGGPGAIEAVLGYLARVAPTEAARHREALTLFLARFTVGRYPDLSTAERDALHEALVALDATVRSRGTRRNGESRHAHAMAQRNAWAALRLEQAFIYSGREGGRALRTIRLRDSVMAENTKWALQQAGPTGRIVVFAHNGHALNVPLNFPAMGAPMVMMGQRLRADFGPRLRAIGTSSDAFVGLGDVLKDMSSFEAALAGARPGNYYLDLRSADRIPAVSSLLRAHWLTRIHAWLQPFVPRETMDVVVALDTVRATRVR